MIFQNQNSRPFTVSVKLYPRFFVYDIFHSIVSIIFHLQKCLQKRGYSFSLTEIYLCLLGDLYSLRMTIFLIFER